VRRRHVLVLLGLTAIGATLRFWALGRQSFWLDEAFTIDVVRRPFAGMLREIPHTGSTPPLYYILAWPWTRVFGLDELGLRSLSALAGTATIPVVYAAGRTLASIRVGLVAAALVATNPLLVWYSQEARGYALLVLLSAASLAFFAEALERPRARILVLWAATGALAVAAHYFALFLVLGEAAILLTRLPNRRNVLAAALVLVPVAALAPLALHQAGRSLYAYPMTTRLWELVRRILVGYYPAPHLAVAAGVAAAVGVVLLVRWPAGRERRTAAIALALGATVVGIPLAFAALGHDFFVFRNVIGMALVLALLAGAVLGARRAGAVGPALAAVVALLSVFVTVRVSTSESLARDDWRAAERSLGPPRGTRLVVTGPWEWYPLKLYRRNLRPLGPGGARVDEIALVGVTIPDRLRPRTPFAEFEERRVQHVTVARYRSATPLVVRPSDLRGRGAPWWTAGIYVDARGADDRSVQRQPCSRTSRTSSTPACQTWRISSSRHW
jgi:mannosyltransferase